MSEIIQDLKNSRCRSYSWSIIIRKAHALLSTSKNQRKSEQKKTDLELHKINGVIQAVTYVQCYADALSDGVIANLELASEPITSARRNERKRPAEESFTTITPPPNLHIEDTSIEASPSNDRYESDVRITREVDNSPFIAQTGEDSTKYKFVLSWSHAIDKVVINNVSENDWVTQNGHNISTDFRNFQLKSIEKLKTNPTLSYAKEISLILCLSSIMYCEFKPEYLECSEKTWSEWRSNWSKGNSLLTDEDEDIFDCVQIVSRNFFTYLSSESYIEDKKLDEDTFIHRYCHRAFISLS
ncbi:unnamed protein product [Rhizophagus irregularis]|uniref:Uncharacterized protein n=1 Tax=Rhizophagus irregularis TaxID=588596 RepID=A0A916E056_9GLOM|nr:unnamed protein product [Rhizophagus irregularis]CAB5338764.1 unnamed protein product [Rhizophagus irregularis]